MDPAEDSGRDALDVAHRLSMAHLAGLAKRPPACLPVPQPATSLSATGVGAITALADFNTRWGHLLSGSPGPRYWGFVNGGVTPAALAADWLCSTYDQNGQVSEGPGALIEEETIGLLRELLNVPESYVGNFVSGGTMANMSCLAIALQRLGAKAHIDVGEQGVAALGPVRILSGEGHGSIGKAAAILGLGRAAVERLPQEADRERVELAALERRLIELRGSPVIVVGNAGTVTTGDFDDLSAVGDLARKHGAHFHVDAAFGIFAALSPRHAHLLRGIEHADTIAADAHKWLNVPFDSGFLFTRDRDAQMQMFKTVSSYLSQPTSSIFNPQHLSPETSRRLRALPAWVSLQAYGKTGYAALVERCTGYAEELGQRIAEEPGFECVSPVRFNVLCFRLLTGNGRADDQETKTFVDRIAEDGRVFVTKSLFKGSPCVRLAFLNWRTDLRDLDVAMQAFRDCRQRTR
ncbi:MAG: pyridoxal-dependent decarboxylase [Rhizomicrobium sp.]|jgi:glutamate/tyrosine decarboxylase-like PLP-dependent enzyme